MIHKIKKWFQFPINSVEEDNDEVENYEDDLNTEELSSPIKDNDMEFLFNQLLEGVVNGWQENRISQFLEKLKAKITVEDWLSWLERYRQQLLSSPAPQTQLAGRMILLGETTACLPFVREIGDSAYDIGQELLNRSNSADQTKINSHGDSSPNNKNKDDRHDDGVKTPADITPANSIDNSKTSQKSPKYDDDYPKPSSLWQDIMALVQEIPSLSGDNSPTSSTKENSDPQSIMEEINLQTDSDTKPQFSTANYSLSAEEVFIVGLEKAQGGDLEKAISLWQDAIDINPLFAPAWHNLGSALACLNRLPEAIEKFDKAIEINVNDYLSWNDRGNAFFRLQKWQEAINSWERVVGIQPNFESAWYYRGLAFEKLKKYPQALTSYEKCLAINNEFQNVRQRYETLKTFLTSHDR